MSMLWDERRFDYRLSSYCALMKFIDRDRSSHACQSMLPLRDSVNTDVRSVACLKVCAAWLFKEARQHAVSQYVGPSNNAQLQP